jgi:hypothetical protein
MSEKIRIDRSKLRDSRSKMRITVNKADVTGASKKDPGNCAVARAVRRCVHAHQAIVHKSRTYVQMKPNGEWLRFETPESARTELISFDRGAGFQEDDYVLRPTRPSARLGVNKRQRKHRQNHTGHKRTPQHIIQGGRVDGRHEGNSRRKI